MNEQKKQKLAKRMYVLGYRFRISFGENAPPPLYIKSANDAGPLMRTCYPNCTIWKTEKVDSEGNVVGREIQQIVRTLSGKVIYRP